jgi:hypothetical protein
LLELFDAVEYLRVVKFGPFFEFEYSYYLFDNFLVLFVSVCERFFEFFVERVIGGIGANGATLCANGLKRACFLKSDV